VTLNTPFGGNNSCILLCIDQHTKFEVPSFSNFNDVMVQNLKIRVTWPWPRPLGGSASSKGYHWLSLAMFYQQTKLVDSFQPFREYDCGRRNWKMGHVTLIRPLWGVVVIRKLGYNNSLPVYKISRLQLQPFQGYHSSPKISNRSRHHDHAPWWGSVISANWNSGWLTCNMGCSRQSLTKLAPVNGINVCELVLVPEMDVSNACLF